MANPHETPLPLMMAEIEPVKAQLRAGRAPSEIANALHARGFGALQIVWIFREATDVPLGDLKAFGQWWGHDGVTDTRAFDELAAEVLAKTGTRT